MSPRNVISAFSEEHVERLTGITVNQLRYWDRTGFFVPSLVRDARQVSISRCYSFRDVVSLKIINAIRNESEVPLQHLREVKRRLLHLGEDMWAKTTLYVLDRRVIFYNPDIDKNEDISGQLVLDEIPLKVVSGDMQKAVRSLRERAPETVGKIIKQRGTAANKPVIAGTRIPVKSIKAFSDAGYSIEQIREQYPILTEEDIRAALAYRLAA
jgi:uncharacterized protein (DUF433 family)